MKLSDTVDLEQVLAAHAVTKGRFRWELLAAILYIVASLVFWAGMAMMPSNPHPFHYPEPLIMICAVSLVYMHISGLIVALNIVAWELTK